MRQCSYLCYVQSLLGITLIYNYITIPNIPNLVGAKEPGCCEPTKPLLSASPAAEPFAQWRTEMYLPLPNAQSWLANTDILKSSVRILQERKNAFGLHVIHSNGYEGYSLGRICFRHQKSISLFVRALRCFGRLR